MGTSIIIAPHLPMKRIGSILFICFFFLALTQFGAQQDDPSEIFLKAYMTAQQGEKFEHENQFKTALTKYRSAGNLIEELRKSHPDWQPAIVDYRGRKISEGILRIQDKISTQSDLASGASRSPEAVPAPSQGGGQSEAGVEPPRASETTPRASGESIKATTKKLRDNLDQLQAALEKSQSDLETARKEKELVNTRLQQSNSKLEKAQSEVEKSKKAEHEVSNQLAQAQESLKALQSSRDSSTKEQEQLRAEVARLKDAVAAANEARVTAEKQKDETGAKADETMRLAKENELLRNIVVRERQEEARRYQAKKLMLAELDKLKIQSDALNKQIEFLAQPVTKLSDEELALLRQPVVAISDQNSGMLKASFMFAKKSSLDPVEIGQPNEKEKPTPDAGAATTNNSSDAAVPSDFKPDVPDDLQDVARAAKESFAHGKYRAAESQYQEILAESPNNLYALSNLGVVYFRRGKFNAAESTLKKALSVSPKDEFVHTTLGIVYYRQSKFDDAFAELTKSLAINPKSPIAHNYLGITAGQKGRLGEAEREILQAIANNPDYGDAHFNLDVIFATTRPASNELAKRHYNKATALGTQPDSSLEKLLQ